MNRRNFLSLLSAGIAGIALEQAIPLGRVWSFPKEIVVPRFRALDIGDVVILSEFLMTGYFEPFIITDVYESATGLEFGLKAPRHNIAGTAPGKALEPWPTAAFPPDSSHTPS